MNSATQIAATTFAFSSVSLFFFGPDGTNESIDTLSVPCVFISKYKLIRQMHSKSDNSVKCFFLTLKEC